MPAFFPRKRIIFLVLLLYIGALPALAAGNVAPAAPVPSKPLQPKHIDWSFEGLFGAYDRPSLQRGFKVYKEACSSCHALSHVAFRDLGGPGGPGFSAAEVAAIAASYKVLSEPDRHGKKGDAGGAALMRQATPADNFPPPFANEQAMRKAMNGALPPDDEKPPDVAPESVEPNDDVDPPLLRESESAPGSDDALGLENTMRSVGPTGRIATASSPSATSAPTSNL